MTTAASVLRRVADVLQEKLSGVRWPADELVRWLNDGQREIAVHMPDATSTVTDFTCGAGSRQVLPPTGIKPLDVLHNSTGRKRVVRGADRDEIDAQVPGWRGMREATEAVHWWPDPDRPTEFEVYPPVAAGTQVRLVYSQYPTPITEPVASANYDTVTGDLTVRDVYANALVDYVIYRAFSKETEYADKQAAALHYGAFAQSIGLKVEADRSTRPAAKP